MSGDKKWSCDYCTYENYPASKRCTLCRKPKHPKYISDAEPQHEQDIYQLAPLICPPKPPSSSPTLSPTLDTTNKWPCQACTYLNWPKSIKCTQCLTVRTKAVLTQENSQTKPLSINVNIESAAKQSTPRTSPNSPEAAKALNNDKNKALALAVQPSCVSTPLSKPKWVCKACTYENWPKSVKCTLCGTPRGRAYSEPPRSSPSSPTPSASSIVNSGSSDLINIDAPGPANNLRNTSMQSSPGSRKSSNENLDHISQGGAAAPPVHERTENKKTDDKRRRQIISRLRESDWRWLHACQGVIEGNTVAIEEFLAGGGDPARQLTNDECVVLNRPSAFEKGHTLVHLAIRFQREDMLAALLTATEMVQTGKKRVPCHVAPGVANEILRDLSLSLRQRKGDFPCYFLTEDATFSLPAEIDDFPLPVRKRLFDELLDHDVQKELEDEESVINWNVEITERLGSRLYALWNRTAGDCLLDSVLQASWGVFDRDNSLRRALADSLLEGANLFYPQWKEAETMQAELMHFALDETQWQRDWAILLSLASQPGSSLEQIHIQCLAHILRRPIIVYGIKFVKSFRGENLGFARFQGVYLPLLWEASFCWRNPIAIGYTRGHFSALVPMEVDSDSCIGAGAHIDNSDISQTTYLPLTDNEGKTLPIHFLPQSEVGREETLLRERMDCCLTDGGLLVAQQKLCKRPLLVKQMIDEWLDGYRRLAQVLPSQPPRASQTSSRQEQLSSDEETDDE